MPFVRMKGVVGKVYVPDRQPVRLKKHPCQSCYTCQMCGDDRCRVCREGADRVRDSASAPVPEAARCRWKGSETS